MFFRDGLETPAFPAILEEPPPDPALVPGHRSSDDSPVGIVGSPKPPIMEGMEVSELANETRRELNRIKQSEELSQRDIALKCKTNPGFVSQVLAGDGELQTDTIERIAKGLGYRVVIQFEKAAELEHAAAAS